MHDLQKIGYAKGINILRFFRLSKDLFKKSAVILEICMKKGIRFVQRYSILQKVYKCQV